MKKLISIFTLTLCGILQSCTFGKLLDPEKSKFYYIRYGEICYRYAGGLVPTKINADRKSFVVLSEYIGKDKDFIYYQGEAQDNVDYSTFRVDENGIPKDKNYVYQKKFSKVLEPLPITGVDIESFQYLKRPTSASIQWGKDKNHYYLGYSKINTDYETTKFAGNDFFYDKTKLYTHFNMPPYMYFIQEIIAPPKTLTKKYIQYNDKLLYLKFISYEKVELIKIDYTSINNLKIINDHVIAINDTVLYYGTNISHFDAETFEKIKDNEMPEHIRHYKDKNFVYLDTKIIKQADPKTFVMIDYSLAKDDKHVFYRDNILEGADPKSFRKNAQEFGEWIDDYGNRFDSKGNKIIVVEDTK